MTSFEQLLRSLAEARVDFIVVGGIAGGLHGAARTTYDLDVVYARDTPNLARLVGGSDLFIRIFAVLPRGSRFGGTRIRSPGV